MIKEKKIKKNTVKKPDCLKEVEWSGSNLHISIIKYERQTKY